MYKKGISLCLSVFLVCISIAASAQEKSPSRIVSERLIPNMLPCGDSPRKVSPDGKRVAYSADAGNKWFVVVGGKEEKQYDGIGENPIFSPDSKRVAYEAKAGNKQFMVVDGKEEKQYDGIGKGTLIFSPDSKRVAYGAGVGNKRFVVVDGKEGNQYNGIGGNIIFDSSDSLHYLAVKIASMYLVEEIIK